MRLGIQKERHDPKTGRLIMPSLHRVLYRPWIYYGTPLWEKFENPKSDLRRKRGGKVQEPAVCSGSCKSRPDGQRAQQPFAPVGARSR